MDPFSGFDESPPHVLLEDDNEIELGIIHPILDEIIQTVVSDKNEVHQLDDLQRFVEIQMEKVNQESEAEKLNDMVKNIVVECATDSVFRSDPNKSPTWISSSPPLNTSCRMTSESGQIERNNDASTTKSLPATIPEQPDKTVKVRQVAEVRPFEAPHSEESEEDPSDGIAVDTIMLDDDSNQEENNTVEESDPFAGMEEAETNNQDQNVSNEAPQPSSGGTLGLRLKSFAVDPSMTANASTSDVSPSNASSWHYTDEVAPPPPYQPQQPPPQYVVPPNVSLPQQAGLQNLQTFVQQPQQRPPIILHRILNQQPSQPQGQVRIVQGQQFQNSRGQLYTITSNNSQQFVLNVSQPHNQVALAPMVNVSLPQQPLPQQHVPQQRPQVQVVMPPPPPVPTSTNAVNVMKETHTIKFCHLALECQLSYHIDLARVTYYHILTAVQPNNTQRGLFKVFIPSSTFNNVFPSGQSSLIANLVIQTVQDGNTMVPKGTISFPTIQFRISGRYPLNIEEAQTAILAENIMIIPPQRVMDFYKIFTPQKFLYYAIHNPTSSIMAVSLARSALPYAQEMFEYIHTAKENIVSKPHRTVTVMRLNMVMTLLKGAFPHMNATRLEEAIHTKTSGIMIKYKDMLLQTLEKELARFKSSHGGIVPYEVRIEPLPVPNVEPAQDCGICDFKGTLKAVHEHLACNHFVGILSRRFTATTGKCPINVNCRSWPHTYLERMAHLGVSHKMSLNSYERFERDFRRTVNMSLKSKQFLCPDSECARNNTFFTMWELLLHYSKHATQIGLSCVKDLQIYQSMTKNQCPIDGCQLTFANNLLPHVLCTHLGVVGSLWNKLKEVRDQNKTRIALRTFVKSANDVEYYCDKCAELYGNISDFNFHVARQHDTVQLMDAFKRVCKDKGKKKACVCGKEFDTPYAGGLHLGLSKCVLPRDLPPPPPAAKTLGDMVVTVVPPSNAQENWSYTCPICGNAFNENNDKTKSMNKLVVHIINAHEHENFDNVLNYLDNSCPYNGCLKKFAQRISLRVHILKYHPDYLLGFLKKYNKNLDLKQCFIVNQPQPSTSNVQVTPVVQVTTVNPGSNRDQLQQQPSNVDDDVVVIDPNESSPLFKEYLEYCKSENIAPYSCKVNKVTLFIKHAYFSFKKSIQEITALINELEPKHCVAGLSTHPLICHAFKQLGDQASRPLGAITNKIIKNDPKNVFLCWSCESEFGSVSGLVKHLEIVGHAIISVGCKYCELKTELTDNKSAERLLVLHTFSRCHLYNRWRILVSKNEFTAKRTIPNDQLNFSRCEICAEDVSNLESHVLSPTHKDNAFIVNHFVAHCDFKSICPVTCPMEEIQFYLKYVYPKTLMPDESRKFYNVNIITLVGTLSKVHDPFADGKVVSGSDAVFATIQTLLSSSKESNSWKFICYGCSFFAKDMKELTHHYKTAPQHSNIKNSRPENFRCESCNRLFREFWMLELHCYNTPHIANYYDQYAGLGKPLVENKFMKRPIKDGFCRFCQIICQGCSKDGHVLEEHFIQDKHVIPKTNHQHIINTPDHMMLMRLIDNFLNYCSEINLHPLNDGVQAASLFYSNTHHYSKAENIEQALRVIGIDTKIKPIKSESRSLLLPSVSLGTAPKNAMMPSSSAPKKIEYEDYGLTSELKELVTKCPECHINCERATYLLYHLRHNHGRNPAKYVASVMEKHNELFICQRCMKKCSSPIVLALHRDRHQINGKHLTCPHCSKNYTSAAVYFANDTCKRNSLPESVKKDVDKIILKSVERSPFSGVIGDREKFSQHFKDALNRPDPGVKKRSRSSSSSSSDERVTKKKKPTTYNVDDSDDDNFIPELVEEHDDVEGLEVRSGSSRSSSRASSRDSEEPEVVLRSCQVSISLEDQERAQNALRLEELKKMIKPCYVKIARDSPRMIMAPVFKPMKPMPASLKRERYSMSSVDIPKPVVSNELKEPSKDIVTDEVQKLPSSGSKPPSRQSSVERPSDIVSTPPGPKRNKNHRNMSTPFKCSLCDRAYSVNDSVIRHIRQAHDGYANSSREVIDQLIVKDTTSEAKSIKRDRSISVEIKKEPTDEISDDTPEPPVKKPNIEESSESIPPPKVANHHAYKTDKPRPFVCGKCQTPFTTKNNCERHMRNVHKLETREEWDSHMIIHDELLTPKSKSKLGPKSKIETKPSLEPKPTSEEEKLESKAKPKLGPKLGPKSKKSQDATQQSILSYAVPSPSSSNVTQEIPKPVEKSSKSNKDVFCLDCESCLVPNCSHMDHPRKFVNSKNDHIQDYAHGRFQDASDVVKPFVISVQDIAYDQTKGPQFRKLYKKYAAANKDTSKVNLFEYSTKRKCLVPSCNYEVDSIVYMLRHIRNDHLKDKDD